MFGRGRGYAVLVVIDSTQNILVEQFALGQLKPRLHLLRLGDVHLEGRHGKVLGIPLSGVIILVEQHPILAIAHARNSAFVINLDHRPGVLIDVQTIVSELE